MNEGHEHNDRADQPARVSPLAWPLILLVKVYQRVISPALPPSCRFYPSCSQYALEALQVHGLVKGFALTVWRLLRCAPWHPGGIDHVPPRRTRGGGRAAKPADDCADGRADGPADGRADERVTEERAPC
ncbi:MAG TPA: membrane protein insertion efficiency factor YidD [Pseudonocardia sp.]|jgi:putative membrane protein insertion efficiency factor|uniref:membrane protein insertion efficiency factor YidD n=1 Tax=Pseudonocardia sp. TaxID=60912 RepID=UPI002BEFFB58|nr:membrane protein insertion efficiency factor YidD [Pseudonocardia sp.]HTF55597.1 membrane protein insertion efficiency factor YidD [Pseudonocardia sp.]